MHFDSFKMYLKSKHVVYGVPEVTNGINGRPASEYTAGVSRVLILSAGIVRKWVTKEAKVGFY